MKSNETVVVLVETRQKSQDLVFAELRKASAMRLKNVGAILRPAWVMALLLPLLSCRGTLSQNAQFETPDAGDDSSGSVVFFDAGLHPTTVLPIEVLGPEGYIREIPLWLDSAGAVTRLVLQVSRPAFRDASVNPARGAKASVRVNQQDWIDLTDSTPGLVVREPAKSYGGLGGGFHTVQLTLPVSGLESGLNRVEFRFNQTDGLTIGYRVLALNFLRDDGTLVIPNSAFEFDEPAAWKPELRSDAGIAEGRRLWSSGKLNEGGGPNAIEASCGHCHASDGRDLKYFNFSSWSIEARSVFHGLTSMQGKQIASYIRSLPVPAPGQAPPWNTPYYPGPGLDAQPVEEWAAGAGLNAVLASDADMLSYLFPKGTSRASLKEAMLPSGTLNLLEIPIAVQFPDWNEWLPSIHPIDIWDNFESTPVQAASADIVISLRHKNVDDLVAAKTLPSKVGSLNQAVMAFLDEGASPARNWRAGAGGRGPGKNLKALKSVSIEEAKRSLAKWIAVRQWDVMQTYALEGLGQRVFGATADARVWPSNTTSVFQVAPHFVANDISHFHAEQTQTIGKYQSTVWYQLQVTLNPASRQPVNVFPVDWPYQYLHIWQTAHLSKRPKPLRYVASLIKNSQMRDNGLGPSLSYNGFQLRNHQPWLFYSDQCGDERLMVALDDAQPGLRRAMTEALIDSWLDFSQRPEMALSTWPRQTTNTELHFFRWVGLERADYVPQPAPATVGMCDSSYEASDNRLFDLVTLKNADSMFRLLPKLKALDLDSVVLSRLIDWSANAWPGGDWKQFR